MNTRQKIFLYISVHHCDEIEFAAIAICAQEHTGFRYTQVKFTKISAIETLLKNWFIQDLGLFQGAVKIGWTVYGQKRNNNIRPTQQNSKILMFLLISTETYEGYHLTIIFIQLGKIHVSLSTLDYKIKI